MHGGVSVFGVGLTELLVIGLVGILILGPDRLPELARQAGRLTREVRALTQAAREDLRKELGPGFADLELSDLDPRRAVREHILEVSDEEDDAGLARLRPGLRPLERGR
jgi:sec-independent protein translocase protein TatB